MDRVTVLFAALVATIGFAGTAHAAEANDQKAAEAAVLTQADMPVGFTGGPIEDDATDDAVPPECAGSIGKADASVEKSANARSGFQLSGGGYAIIQSDVAVLSSAGKARKAIKAYRDEDAAKACLTARFEEFFAEPGVDASISLGTYAPEMDAKGNAEVIDGGDEFLGFAGSVRRSAGGQPQFFEIQTVLVREGRSVARLIFVTQGSVPQDDVQQMLQTTVDNLATV